MDEDLTIQAQWQPGEAPPAPLGGQVGAVMVQCTPGGWYTPGGGVHTRELLHARWPSACQGAGIRQVAVQGRAGPQRSGRDPLSCFVSHALCGTLTSLSSIL